MPNSQNHKWQFNDEGTKAKCDVCKYTVRSAPDDEETRGGSKHMPQERCIYTQDRKLTPRLCDHLCAVWGVRCHE